MFPFTVIEQRVQLDVVHDWESNRFMSELIVADANREELEIPLSPISSVFAPLPF
jgi:hypothetical protein